MSKSNWDIRDARIMAAQRMPYFRKYIYSMPLVEAKGLGTCACDQYGRMYYDPTLLKKWKLEEMATVICHEVSHLVGGHHRRAKLAIGPKPSRKRLRQWNEATDCQINPPLKRMGMPLPEYDGAKCCMPELYNLPADYEKHSCEDYYHILAGDEDDEEDGDCGDMPGGSGADGVARGHEQGPPSDSEPGLDEDAQNKLEREVAKDIQEESRSGRGNVPGHMKKWADQILKPKFDPKKELKAQCRGAMSTKPGFGFQTYQRPSRRQMGDARLPVQRMPSINVAVCIDTSGSMGGKDTGLALGVFGECCNHLPRENIVVYTGDTHAGSCQRVFDPKQVNLVGGGGTDMGAMIEHAMEQKPRPDVVLVATDGDTPWCDPVNAKVVAAMTRKDFCVPPKWIRAVYIGDE